MVALEYISTTLYVIVSAIVNFFFSTFFIALPSTYSVASFFRFSLFYAICILSLFLYPFLYLSFLFLFKQYKGNTEIKVFQLNLKTDSFVVRLPHTYSSLWHCIHLDDEVKNQLSHRLRIKLRKSSLNQRNSFLHHSLFISNHFQLKFGHFKVIIGNCTIRWLIYDCY